MKTSPHYARFIVKPGGCLPVEFYGRSQDMAKTPRYWQVNATVRSEDERTLRTDYITFKTSTRRMVTSLTDVIHHRVNKEIQGRALIEAVIVARILM